MKTQFITIVCLLTIFSACSTKSKKLKEAQIEANKMNELNEARADSLIKLAELSTLKISELPLGLSFEMSESEVNQQLNKLMDEKILENWGSNFIQYSYVTANGIKVEYFVRFWVHENKLYHLQLDLISDYQNDSIYKAIIEDLSLNYNSDFDRISYQYESFGDTIIFNEWIKDNQIVRFKRSTSGFMADVNYIDAPINHIVFKEQINEREDELRAGSKIKELGLENNSFDGSVSKIETYLKNNLKDPRSYESIEWSNMTSTDNGYMIRHKYRAKNSFGALEVVNQVFYLDSNGEIIGVSNYN